MSQTTEGRSSKLPAQSQSKQPGSENAMIPSPQYQPRFKGADKLLDKVALITGGDSGIGRAIAIAFAREGADVAIAYLDEIEDALKTKELIEKEGRNCLLLAGDLGQESFCEDCINKTISRFGKLDVLVNNAAEQHQQVHLENISAEQLEKTFKTNVFAFFYLTKFALPHLKAGSSIINSTSVTAFKGNPHLVDYSSTKGAIVAFTRALSEQVIERGIRVNAVAPGPIWTPLIPASFDEEHVAKFGQNVPMKRPGQPNEVSPAYVFLASDDSSYISGQVIHPNGGTIVA